MKWLRKLDELVTNLWETIRFGWVITALVFIFGSLHDPAAPTYIKGFLAACLFLIMAAISFKR